jgi:hypothetical protein
MAKAIMQLPIIYNMVPDSDAPSLMFTGVKVIIVNYGQGNHAVADYLTTWCLWWAGSLNIDFPLLGT